MKVTFRNKFESLRYVAKQNEAWFDDTVALRLWKQALEVATLAAERAEAEHNIERLAAELKEPRP